MISIIICSISDKLFNDISQNIKNTIGIDIYEILKIDNTSNEYSIAEAYNIGMERSKFPYLVFLHEDVLFHTDKWGEILLRNFRINSEVGLIGIAGSKALNSMPAPWWRADENVWNLIQHFKDKPKEKWNQGFKENSEIEVAIIDGVFMAMKRHKKIKFDERLNGFHNYDLCLSLQHYKYGKKVLVINGVLLEHFSEGNLDKSWYKSTSRFYQLYKNFLPCQVGVSASSSSQLMKSKVMVGYKFINGLIDESLLKEALYWWWQLFKLKPVSKYHFRILNKIIFR